VIWDQYATAQAHRHDGRRQRRARRAGWGVPGPVAPRRLPHPPLAPEHMQCCARTLRNCCASRGTASVRGRAMMGMACAYRGFTLPQQPGEIRRRLVGHGPPSPQPSGRAARPGAAPKGPHPAYVAPETLTIASHSSAGQTARPAHASGPVS